MPKPTVDYAGVPLPEIRIMTTRLLSAKTTESVLNAIDPIPHIRQVNMAGESLPKTINSGPAKGLPNNHSERQLITVAGREVELRCEVGAFYIELDEDVVGNMDLMESVVEQIRAACDANIKDGYQMDIGRYSKYKPSLNDYRSA